MGVGCKQGLRRLSYAELEALVAEQAPLTEAVAARIAPHDAALAELHALVAQTRGTSVASGEPSSFPFTPQALARP